MVASAKSETKDLAGICAHAPPLSYTHPDPAQADHARNTCNAMPAPPAVVLQKIFWPQLVVLMNMRISQYLVWSQSFCNAGAERNLEGIEEINMLRKDQVKRLSDNNAQGQAKFVASLFQIAA
jgi:hypothetical protein